MGKSLYVLESHVTDLEKEGERERENGRGDDYPSSDVLDPSGGFRVRLEFRVRLDGRNFVARC